MSKTPARERRRRRIASDEAHAWARNLRLNNPYAKSILRALTFYVNESGACNPGISTIAEDVDLSEDTVRKRLKFLEEVGAIVRLPCWRDDQGRVNTEGRGKRTTDEIRLMIDADRDTIEARAAGDDVVADDSGSDEFSPRPQQGLNSGDTEISPRPALGQPSQYSEGLISEPEPEPSPQAPLRGGVGDASDQDKDEPEHFAEFFDGYPGHRVMDRARALDVFRALTEAERLQARAAAPLYAEDLAALKRRPKDAYKWLRDRVFEQYPHAKIAPQRQVAQAVWYPQGSREVAALDVALAIAGEQPPDLRNHPDHPDGPGIRRSVPIGADLVALADYTREQCADFDLIVVDGSREFAAWRDRLARWLGHTVTPRRIWTEPLDPSVHELSPMDPRHRVRRSVTGLRVPWRWPPRSDGTWPPDGAPTVPAMTDDDIEVFAQEGTTR